MSECHKHIVGSVAIIVDSRGRFLAGERINPHGVGTFGMPSGKVELGEHPRDAAIRETEEETGLVLHGGTLIGAEPGEHRVEEPLPMILSHWIVLFYKFSFPQNQTIKNLDKKNTKEWEWFSLNDPPRPMFGCSEIILKNLAREDT